MADHERPKIELSVPESETRDLTILSRSDIAFAVLRGPVASIPVALPARHADPFIGFWLIALRY